MLASQDPVGPPCSFCGHIFILIAIMLSKPKAREGSTKSPRSNHYRSSELPPKQPLVPLSHRNEQFYSVKQISHRFEHSNEQSSRKHPTSKGEKFATTDESSNAHESNLQESLFFAENKKGKGEAGREKMESTCNTKRKRGERGAEVSRVCFLEGKLRQMRELVLSHEMELRKMKSEMKQRELFRLLKIHSIEKVKVLEGTHAASRSKKSK